MEARVIKNAPKIATKLVLSSPVSGKVALFV